MRALLAGSPLRESHRGCGQVQDAYSLRCVPQVHGAVRDAVAFAAGKVEIEINSATDNPLVFEDGTVLSGGNFHGAPVAMACDVAALALTDLASIAERRIERLVSRTSGPPPFLVEEAASTGFMIAQITQPRSSRVKPRHPPPSTRSRPGEQEDHVPMGPIAARLDASSRTWRTCSRSGICGAGAQFRRPLLSSHRSALRATRSAARSHRGRPTACADFVAMRRILDEVWRPRKPARRGDRLRWSVSFPASSENGPPQASPHQLWSDRARNEGRPMEPVTQAAGATLRSAAGDRFSQDVPRRAAPDLGRRHPRTGAPIC
jgi:hypothetical protein